MSGKLLKDKLQAGKTVYGTMFAHSLDPSIVKWIPEGALDFVIVTPEHTAYDLAEFLPVRHALEAKGIACLARTHGRDEADVARVCDTYDGVVVPYVEDYEEAKRLAAAAVYRPLKGKVLTRVLATGQWPNDKTRDFIAAKNADTVFVPMIESVPAVQNLDGICSLPGVDALFVGLRQRRPPPATGDGERLSEAEMTAAVTLCASRSEDTVTCSNRALAIKVTLE